MRFSVRKLWLLLIAMCIPMILNGWVALVAPQWIIFITVIGLSTGVCIISILIRDITALKYLAIHDGLTGLINHREFYLRLTEEHSRSMRHGRPMTLLMLDVDHFKKFNDAYGHQKGDLVLKLIARVLKASVRQSDLVARYGGEEFAILLPETPLEEGIALGSRIQKVLADRGCELTGTEGVRITVSIGVAAYPIDATTVDQLVHVADQRLYMAKNTARNRICASRKAVSEAIGIGWLAQSSVS